MDGGSDHPGGGLAQQAGRIAAAGESRRQVAQDETPSRLRDARQPLAAWRHLATTELILVGALQLHYASTGRVDIRATCHDVVDEGEHHRKLVSQTETVEPIRLADAAPMEIAAQGTDPRSLAVVDREGGRLNFLPERWGAGGQLLPAAAPVHKIGHTRHVTVTYQAVATSRFADDFPQDQELKFTRESEPITIGREISPCSKTTKT